MKHNFEERRNNRITHAQEQARKSNEESDAALNRAHAIGSAIPFGQPILVGHHSEKRHRRDLERIDNSMRKSVELDKKAAYYTNKAQAIEENTAIFSDDPNALDKLKEKLKGLEELQKLMVETNKVLRKHTGKRDEQIKALVGMGFTEARAHKLTDPETFQGVGFPHYSRTNNSANIRRIKQRIIQLEKVAQLSYEERELPNGAKLIVNVDANRLQVVFPGKPDERTREMLKGQGFRWAPSEGAWQRHLHANSINWYYKKLTEYLATAE